MKYGSLVSKIFVLSIFSAYSSTAQAGIASFLFGVAVGSGNSERHSGAGSGGSYYPDRNSTNLSSTNAKLDDLNSSVQQSNEIQSKLLGLAETERNEILAARRQMQERIRLRQAEIAKIDAFFASQQMKTSGLHYQLISNALVVKTKKIIRGESQLTDLQLSCQREAIDQLLQTIGIADYSNYLVENNVEDFEITLLDNSTSIRPDALFDIGGVRLKEKRKDLFDAEGTVLVKGLSSKQLKEIESLKNPESKIIVRNLLNEVKSTQDSQYKEAKIKVFHQTVRLSTYVDWLKQHAYTGTFEVISATKLGSTKETLGTLVVDRTVVSTVEKTYSYKELQALIGDRAPVNENSDYFWNLRNRHDPRSGPDFQADYLEQAQKLTAFAYNSIWKYSKNWASSECIKKYSESLCNGSDSYWVSIPKKGVKQISALTLSVAQKVVANREGVQAKPIHALEVQHFLGSTEKCVDMKDEFVAYFEVYASKNDQYADKIKSAISMLELDRLIDVNVALVSSK